MRRPEEVYVERQFGLPVYGYISTQPRHELPTGALGPDTTEIIVESGSIPETTKARRRRGAQQISEASGITEIPTADASAISLELFELPTNYSVDGKPVLAGIFADEDKRYGTLCIIDNDDIPYTLGEEFSNYHWPVASSTDNHIKMPALPYDGNGATGYNRLVSNQARRRTIAGTRSRIGVGNSEYGGGYDSCPWRWRNRGFNRETDSGENTLEFFPMGLLMPLRPPDFPAIEYPAADTTGPWVEGDTFFATYTFVDESGQESMPFLPRDKGNAGILPNGAGLVTVKPGGGSSHYSYIPWIVGIGPPGTVKRKLYRSKKVSKSLVTSGDWPAIDKLYFCGIIEDNIQTRYHDPRGNDGSLVDADTLRLDQVWPDRSKYSDTIERRQIIGHLRPGPCAIVTAPSGYVASGDQNFYNAYSTPGAKCSTFRIVLASGVKTLYLRYLDSIPDAAPDDFSIVLSGTMSLQELVDRINTLTIASACKEWGAQLVPGANMYAAANTLAPTSVHVPTCTYANDSLLISTVGDGFKDVAEGMVINSVDFPPGTYVNEKVNDNTLSMSEKSTALFTGGTIEFYADLGDDGLVTDGTKGNYRVFHQAYPGIIGFTQEYLDQFEARPRDVMLTSAQPSEKPFMVNLFHTSPGGRHTVDSDAGIYMGAGRLAQGAVLWYSKQTHILKNVKSGDTGLDEDYHVFPMDTAHGSLSPYAHLHGNGWAGTFRDDGLYITDGERSVIISNDVFLPSKNTGNWIYERNRCVDAINGDTNDFGFFAAFINGMIIVSYRQSSGVGATQIYDCSPSIEGVGVAQVLRPDGSTYPWSSPLHYSYRSANGGCNGPIVGMKRVSGTKMYQSDNRADADNCGLLQEFETTGSYYDGIAPVTYSLHTATDLVNLQTKHQVKGLLTFLYKLASTNPDATVTVNIHRNLARTATSTILLPTTGTDIFTRKQVMAPMKASTPSELTEIEINGGSDYRDTDFEFSGVNYNIVLTTTRK